MFLKFKWDMRVSTIFFKLFVEQGVIAAVQLVFVTSKDRIYKLYYSRCIGIIMW